MDANSAARGAMLACMQQASRKRTRMSIGAITANPLVTANSSARGGSNGISGFLPTQNNAAKSAASATILPSSSAVQLSPEMLLMLQGANDSAPAEATPASLQAPSIEDQFMAEAHKSPMQRMREQVMKAMGVTEEQLAQMSPEERRATEDRIKDLIQEKIREANNAGKGPPDSNTDMLQSLA
jgi:hypothetical protein